MFLFTEVANQVKRVSFKTMMAHPVSLARVFVPLLFLVHLVAADAVQDLWEKGEPALDEQLAKSATCPKDKLQVRKEWGDLTDSEKSAYIDAVLCITNKPSKLDQTRYPGAKTRFDDFVAVHINQTMNIHGTGSFLSWHRYFTWAYEQALRNECGYNGTQPYWHWGRWAEDPESSPIFDGSMLSMSGNGEAIEHTGVGSGNGGGCVTSGPFKNFTVNLGPMAAAIRPAPKANPRRDGFGHNPRCLRRDIGPSLTSRYARTQDVVSLITNAANVASFQNIMQAAGNPVGVHVAGHFTIAGDPGGDFYVSPGDPAFYLHHAMIDRTWTIWQMQDLPNRLQVIAGGTSMVGFSSRQQSLDDPVDLDVVGQTYAIKELVSVVDGPFCYYYA